MSANATHDETDLFPRLEIVYRTERENEIECWVVPVTSSSWRVMPEGWYWSTVPGPSSDDDPIGPIGPFASAAEALADARQEQ